MRSWLSISVAVAMVVWASHSGGQDKPADYVLSTTLQREADAIHREHPKARLFQVAIVDFVPAAIGVDCSASLSIDSGFASEDNVRYYAVLGRFSACDGSQSSSPRISLRTFRTVPCKPRYAEEESTKSCGGPLDDPESEGLHHSLEVPVAALSKIFDILREKGVQLCIATTCRSRPLRVWSPKRKSLRSRRTRSWPCLGLGLQNPTLPSC